MYEAHFGLQGRPFDTGIAHEVDVFRGARQNTIIDKAKLALAASDSVVTFCGPPGIGKTTLALAAVRSISTRLALAWLSSMPTNANEMLELLLVELGINAHRATRIERLQMWRQYLQEMSATDTRVFVIAERTEELAPEVLRALDALTGADASGSPGANVVLLGHQGLDGFLGSPSLESLRQRIRLRQRLAPFSSSELTDYLRHRVTQAGGNFDRLFAPGAAAAVYRLTAGVARLANTLCEAALTEAAAAKAPALTPELIARVAVDMLGVEGIAAPVTPTQPAVPAATSTVTIASVAIDITPAKAAAVVAAPRTASAAPRAAESALAPAPAPMTPAPMTPAPQPTTAPAPMTAVTTPAPVPVPPALAPVPETSVAPVARAASPTVAPAAPVAPAVAAAPAPAAPAAGAPPQPTFVRPAPMATPPPAPPPGRLATPAPSAATSKPTAPRPPAPDFDATATDIPDVSSFDFPVLTDEVDTESLTPFARVLAQPPAPAPAPSAPPAKTIVAPPAPLRAAGAPARHPTIPPLSRPTAAAAAPPAPSRRLLEPKVAIPSAPPPAPPPAVDEDPDVLHQTQAMRAISQAKSIDDVSDSMAETLFGEAELDFLSAALASAVGDGEKSQASASASNVALPPAASPPVDDLMDLFNLGPDAPLELIDDSTIPPTDRRKTAARRGG